MNKNILTPNAVKTIAEAKARIAKRNKRKMKENNQRFKIKSSSLANKK